MISRYAVLHLPAPITPTRFLSILKSIGLEAAPYLPPLTRPCGNRVVLFERALPKLREVVELIKPEKIELKTFEAPEPARLQCRPTRPPYHLVRMVFTKPVLRRFNGLLSSVPEPYFLLRSILRTVTSRPVIAKQLADKTARSVTMLRSETRVVNHMEHKGMMLKGFVGEAEYIVHGCPFALEVMKLAGEVGVGDSPGLGFGCGVKVFIEPLEH